MTQVPAQLELREILRQVFLRHLNMRAFDRPLQHRPERINRIRVHLAAHILVTAMRHRSVVVAKFFQVAIYGASSVLMVEPFCTFSRICGMMLVPCVLSITRVMTSPPR